MARTARRYEGIEELVFASTDEEETKAKILSLRDEAAARRDHADVR